MSLSFEDALTGLRDAYPDGDRVVQVRLTVHGEDGLVVYGYGGVTYQPARAPEPRFVVYGSPTRSLAADAEGIDGFAFDGDSLVTSEAPVPSNARLTVLNNEVFDTSRIGGAVPRDFQTFLVGRFDVWGIRLGWASRGMERAIVLQAERRSDTGSLITRVEMHEEGSLLRGEGSAFFTPATYAAWAMSFGTTGPFRNE